MSSIGVILFEKKKINPAFLIVGQNLEYPTYLFTKSINRVTNVHRMNPPKEEGTTTLIK